MSHDREDLLREIVGDVPRVIALARRFKQALNEQPASDNAINALWAKFYDVEHAAQEALAIAKKAVEE